MRLTRLGLLLVLVGMGLVVPASAQSTTGTIRGHVSDAQGLALPGVMVTVTSPNLQGTRSTVTSDNGDYIVSLLPAGAYAVAFEISGFERLQRSASLAPTQSMPIDVSMGPAAITENVEVVGAAANVLTRTAQVATNFSSGVMSSLPTNRDINASVLMAPQVHPTGVNGAYSIAGAMSFETLFMVNGVSVSDNLRGQPYDLYIEDAIQDTTIATAGVSAEYGRFGGGVVNVVTKSGGNRFSGSFRDTILNDKWRALTPFENTTIAADPAHKETRVDKTVPTYEYTLGGPVAKDRLWFFFAGRYQKQESGRALVVTNVPYAFESKQRRNEAKVTYSLRANHRMQAALVDSFEQQTNSSQNPATAMDANSLYNQKRPMTLFTGEYNGVLSPSFVIEARISSRNETLKDVGARSTDPVNGTLLIDRAGRRYWAATFCGVCGPEQRDGQDVFVKGNYFLSRRGLGSHSMSFGYDGYNDHRVANNHQSGSDYRITGTNAIVQGSNIYAQFLADGATLIQWNPIFSPSGGTNFRTHSLFYSDSWRVSNRVTANLGVRQDRNHGTDSSGTLVADNASWAPRLGVIVDPTGSQKWTVTGSVAKYVDAIANTVANAAAAGGNPDTYQFAYLGPEINKDPNGPLTSTADGIRQVLDWFNSNGGATRTLAPGAAVTVVGVTPLVGNLSSPNVWEYATGVSRQFGSRAALRADALYRRYADFYAIRTDMATGRIKDTRAVAPPAVAGRTYDLSTIENTNVATRRYAGLALQGQYRLASGLEVGGNYTLSRAWGNLDGESPNGPATAGMLQYPEYKQESWNYPEGDLAIDQRHRARIWGNYDLPWISGLAVSALQIIESGVPYGAVSPAGVNPQPYVTNPGYLTPPGGTSTMYYFTARDAFRTEGQMRTDAAVTYRHTLRGVRGLQLFGQLQVLNVLNNYQLCACGASTVLVDGGSVSASRIDQTVRTSVTNSSLYQSFNPFTATPVEGVNWGYGPNFGKALNRFAYTTPRTLRVTFGVRF
jgi:hypothetical protein